MLFADFLKAAIPGPVTCLGIRLRPLSLGSLLLMFRYQNGFALGLPLKLIGLEDLFQGIIACSLPFADAQAALTDPDLERDLALWARKLDGGFFRRFKSQAQCLRTLADIDNSKARFAEYFADGSAYPCTKAECGPARVMGSAWPMLTLTALMDELRMDFATAINQPLALSRWLVATNNERKGNLEIVERAEVASLQAEADAIAREVFGEAPSPDPSTINPQPSTS